MMHSYYLEGVADPERIPLDVRYTLKRVFVALGEVLEETRLSATATWDELRVELTFEPAHRYALIMKRVDR
jgi:hypothetical protein